MKNGMVLFSAVLIFVFLIRAEAGQFGTLSVLPPELIELILQNSDEQTLSVSSLLNTSLYDFICRSKTLGKRLGKYLRAMQKLNAQVHSLDQSFLLQSLCNTEFYSVEFYDINRNKKHTISGVSSGLIYDPLHNTVKLPFMIFNSSPQNGKEQFFNVLIGFKKDSQCFGRIIFYPGLFDQFSCGDLLKLHQLYPNARIEDAVGNTILHALVKNYFCTINPKERIEKINLIKTVCERSKFLVNQKNLQGNTPSHVAVSLGSKKLYNFFKTYGADPMQRNKYGDTPYSLLCSRDQRFK